MRRMDSGWNDPKRHANNISKLRAPVTTPGGTSHALSNNPTPETRFGQARVHVFTFSKQFTRLYGDHSPIALRLHNVCVCIRFNTPAKCHLTRQNCSSTAFPSRSHCPYEIQQGRPSGLFLNACSPLVSCLKRPYAR